MKTIHSIAVAGLSLLPLVAMAGHGGVREDKQWEREFAFDRGVSPHVVVKNVWGEVRVTTHGGNQVVVKASESRRARDAEDLDRSRDLIYLDVIEGNDSLELIVDGIARDYNGRRPRCRDCELHVDFEIQVPVGASLDVGTVMNGAVHIADVAGPVAAHNVNGDVFALGMHACGHFETVNGEVEVSFAEAPAGKCRFETINGDMNVSLPGGAGADLALELGNGSIYSDFDVEPLDMPATISSEKAGSGTRYTISKAMGVRIGRGGPSFSFESINGDVAIQRIR
jgi:hypothetical protein